MNKLFKRKWRFFLICLLVIVLINQYSILIISKSVYALNEAIPINITINNSNMEVYVGAEPHQITRAEMCRYFVRALKLDLIVSTSRIFSDIHRDNEYYKDIHTVVSMGLTDGYKDGTFRPDGPITRAEFAVILCRALNHFQTPTNEINVGDINNHWAYRHIINALDAGLMSLDENNNFRPNDYLVIDFSSQLLPIITPSNIINKKVIWKSDNEDIAIVDNTGHVTGKSPGFATLTCSFADNSVSKKCYIKVKSQQINPPLFSGFICPNNDTTKSSFNIFINESNTPITTDENGYFELNGSMSDSFIPCKIKIVKDGYLSRVLSSNNYGEISTLEAPLEIWSGDINSDSSINMKDIILIAKSFNTMAGQSTYNKNCDLNMDEVINMSDVLCASKRFGSSSEDYYN